jgi:hypothetical protein
LSTGPSPRPTGPVSNDQPGGHWACLGLLLGLDFIEDRFKPQGYRHLELGAPRQARFLRLLTTGTLTEGCLAPTGPPPTGQLRGAHQRSSAAT